MAKRRTFGSIRKLPSGRWQASYLDPIGRERVPGESTFATKADANLWLSKAEMSLERGLSLDRSGRTRTFADYSAAWLAGKTVRPKTVDLYTYLLNNLIVPHLGEAPLTAITPGAVRSWNSKIRSGTISDTTAAKAYRLLRQIMEAAVDDQLIGLNPCRIKGAAVEHSAEREIPPVSDVLQTADAIDPCYRAMVFLAAFVGLRKGECFGLTRDHIDLDADPPTVKIEQQLSRTDAGEWLLQPPKTAAGNRTVAISGHVATELVTHMARFPQTKTSPYLFPVQRPRKHSFEQCWKLAATETQIGCTFHDLRHVAGTLNAAAGATLKESMARMGHASSNAALRYQHAVKERDGAIAAGIDLLMGEETD